MHSYIDTEIYQSDLMLNDSLIISFNFFLSVIFLLSEKTSSSERNLVTDLSQASENRMIISIILITLELQD